VLKKLLATILKPADESNYEIITPLSMEIITAEAIYSNMYKTVYDVYDKKYGKISDLLKECLENNLNGMDMKKALRKFLKKHPDLLSIFDQAFSIDIKTMESKEILVFFRILESRARRKYQEYNLKLNSLISIFFFYVFLVPTPIILFSEFLPQTSYVLLPAFFISSIIIFRIFFNRIKRIRSVLLG